MYALHDFATKLKYVTTTRALVGGILKISGLAYLICCQFIWLSVVAVASNKCYIFGQVHGGEGRGA